MKAGPLPELAAHRTGATVRAGDLVGDGETHAVSAGGPRGIPRRDSTGRRCCRDAQSRSLRPRVVSRAAAASLEPTSPALTVTSPEHGTRRRSWAWRRRTPTSTVRPRPSTAPCGFSSTTTSTSGPRWPTRTCSRRSCSCVTVPWDGRAPATKRTAASVGIRWPPRWPRGWTKRPRTRGMTEDPMRARPRPGDPIAAAHQSSALRSERPGSRLESDSEGATVPEQGKGADMSTSGVVRVRVSTASDDVNGRPGVTAWTAPVWTGS